MAFWGAFALVVIQSGTDPRAGLMRYETDSAVVYFEPGPLPPAAMERFAHLVDRGIGDIQTFLEGAPHPSSRPITYYVRSDIPMSWSYRRTVLLPMDRVLNDSAPYLHETTHILFPVRSGSLWFAEGFASYVQSYVAEHLGGYDGYVFSKGGNRDVDNLARAYLASPGGRAVLPYVGGDETPPDLYSDRWHVAAPLYVLSHSFVKFLIDNAGLEEVKQLLPAPDIGEALRSASGRGISEWKAAWLASLKGGTKTAGRESPAP
jgi:hypothetical protein